MIVLQGSVLSISIARASILGFVLSIVLLCVLVPNWRRFIPLVLLGIASLLTVSNFTAYYLKPASLQNVDTAFLVGQVTKESAYQLGTFAHRLRIMKSSIDQIETTNWLGGGPTPWSLPDQNSSMAIIFSLPSLPTTVFWNFTRHQHFVPHREMCS